jgi:hypothetical protein
VRKWKANGKFADAPAFTLSGKALFMMSWFTSGISGRPMVNDCLRGRLRNVEISQTKLDVNGAAV